MKKTQDFTQGAIVLPLIRFALPVLAALFLQTMYGAVDLLVVGQYASAADVSAVSTGSQLMHTMTVLISGLAMGITILIGQYMGQKAPERAAKAIGGGIWLFSIVAVIYFNGCGRTWFIMLQGIVGAFLVRIPVAYAISKISGVTLFMIGLAMPSSSLVQILLCLIYYLILWRAEKKH